MIKKALLLSLVAMPMFGFCDEGNYITNQDQQTSQTNGYTQIVIDTNHEQKQPLDTVVTIEFPPGIHNVGQSLNYVLQNSGYHLKELEQTSPDTLHLYTLDIPLSHRAFYQSTVIQITRTLAGESYDVIVDHVKREIEIRPTKVQG